MSEAEIEGAANPPTESKIEVRDSSHGLSSIYSNHFDALWTPHDVKLKFSELTKIVNATEGSSKTMIYEERAHIVVSWVQAKALAAVLAEIIGAYEKINGKIEVPSIP